MTLLGVLGTFPVFVGGGIREVGSGTAFLGALGESALPAVAKASAFAKPTVDRMGARRENGSPSFTKPATDFAGCVSENPKPAARYFLSPRERIKGEGNRKNTLSVNGNSQFKRSSSPLPSP